MDGTFDVSARGDWDSTTSTTEEAQACDGFAGNPRRRQRSQDLCAIGLPSCTGSPRSYLESTAPARLQFFPGASAHDEPSHPPGRCSDGRLITHLHENLMARVFDRQTRF